MSYPTQKTHSVKKDGFPLITPLISLADKNWFKTGGPAQLYAEPKNTDEFGEVLSYRALHSMPICIIGEGANILVSDKGVEGLVIRPSLKTIKRFPYDETHDLVEAGAGVAFPELISWCLENNLVGLEEFSGIPGSVGGAVFINLHYFEFFLSHFLVSAHVISKKTGLVEIVDNKWFNFKYNYSTLHQNEYYLASARFKLKKVDTPTALYAKGRSDEIIRHRAQRYPTSFTCGSFFRNFLPQEVRHTEKKLIYVAYYLDKIGIKGELSVGGAVVSHKHANMIVNQGTATTADIIGLARTMQGLVLEKFGIIPQPECRLLGFDSYPLLP